MHVSFCPGWHDFPARKISCQPNNFSVCEYTDTPHAAALCSSFVASNWSIRIPAFRKSCCSICPARDWNIKSVVSIRRLFERTVSLKLRPKQTKFFFKRYLKFEKEAGDAETVRHVLQRAKEYVEAKAGATAGAGAEA